MRFFLYLLVLFSSTVLAQQQPSIPSGFSFSPPPTDLSVVYLSDIFGVVDGVLHGTGSQILGTMFGVFNAAILTIGGVVVSYILFVSTMNTAHEGKVLGQKWSSIWIPLRAVVGIGAMLPKASGYSFVQIFLMWLVVQGVGAADSVWYAALNYFQRGGILVQHVQSLREMGGSSSNAAFIWGSPAGIMKAETCMYVLRNALENNKPPKGSQPTPVPDFTSSLVVAGASSHQSPPCYKGDARQECAAKIDTGGEMLFPGNISYGSTSLKGACGTLNWSFALSPSTGDVDRSGINYANLGGFDSRSIAVQQMVLDIQPSAYNLAQILMPTGQNQTPRAPQAYDFPSGALVNATTDYLTLMKPFLRTAGEGMAQQVKDSLTDVALRGWIMAGSYYFTLSRLNQAITTIIEKTRPGMYYPQNYSATAFGINPAAKTALAYLPNDPIQYCGGGETPGVFNDYVCREYDEGSKQGGGTRTIPQQQAAPPGQKPTAQPWWQQYSGKKSTDYIQPVWSSYSGSDTGWWVTNKILNIVLLGQFNPIIDALNNVASAQQNNIDPILAVSSLGYKILYAVETIWLTGFLAMMLIGLFALCGASNPFGFSLISGLIWLVPLLTGFLFAMWVAGAVMAFYIPLLPTIVFLFTVIGWFVAVIEAMIAGPLVALGIISPEGHEYFGQAQAAIMLTLNIFIRPTLIIFGFITGSILANVALWFWNLAFATTISQDIVQQNIWAPGTTYLVSFIAIIMIYMTVVLSVVNRCFSLIHEIPNHVLNWIGGNIRQFGEAEGAGAIEGKVGEKIGGMKSMGEIPGGGMRGVESHEKRVEAHDAKKKKGGKGEGVEVS